MRDSVATTYDEFRDHLSEHLRRVGKSKRPTLVVRNGRTAAVILSPKAFEQYERAQEFYETVQAVDQARRQLGAGEGLSVDEARRDLLSERGRKSRSSKLQVARSRKKSA